MPLLPDTLPVRRRVLVGAAALGTGLTLLPLVPADAHVTVSASSAAGGSYSVLTFRVPDESDTASTTEVSVQLPQDTPFSSVRTKPVPGWTLTATTEQLPKPVQVNGATLTKAVRTLTWTAGRGSAIAPGQFQEFTASVGPLPAGGTLLLPATQTYSDGKVVRWDQPATMSEEHPAPAVTVLPIDPPVDAGSQETTGPAQVTTSRADGTARALGGAGLLVALVGTVLAGLALRTARSGRRP